MIALEAIAERLGVAGPWVEKGRVYWLDPGSVNLRDVAREMNACQARFVTITAYELPGNGGFRLEYHWDLDGRLLGFAFQISGNSIESIYDLCEAADWIEREIHEEYAIDFTGREYEPLLLRDGNAIGVNLRETIASAKPAAHAGREDGVPGTPGSGLLGREGVAR